MLLRTLLTTRRGTSKGRVARPEDTDSAKERSTLAIRFYIFLRMTAEKWLSLQFISI